MTTLKQSEEKEKSLNLPHQSFSISWVIPYIREANERYCTNPNREQQLFNQAQLNLEKITHDSTKDKRKWVRDISIFLGFAASGPIISLLFPYLIPGCIPEMYSDMATEKRQENLSSSQEP